ncbi:MAG: ribokinase [Alphaproteobacteria bacterium]|nr:ribokinase [Alphaproteobacteria bacterium]
MIVCFGSINLDLIFPLPHLPVAGQTVLGPNMQIEPGGKGANQAVAAARDGAKVVFAGALGRDALAEDAVETMREAGVDITRVIRVKGAATGAAAICVDPEGRNLIAVASGANQAAKQAQIEEELLGPRTTVLLQRETDPAETEALIARARAAGCRIVLNLAPPGPMSREALSALDVLVVNEDEAAWLTGHLGCPATTAGLHAALDIDVVQTLGADGAEAVTRVGTLRVAGRAITAIDTTGAGDCFTGVLAAALDRGATLALAMQRANAAAGLACTRRGTQGSMPKATETDAALG